MDMDNQREAFDQEVAELLGEVEEAILEVENSDDPADESEAVNRLFRAMHSIKGIAGMFGFDQVTEFTHHVETALDLVRNGKAPVSKELINYVLKSHDMIISLLEDDAVAIPEEGIEIIQQLTLLTNEDAVFDDLEFGTEEKNKEDESDLNSGLVLTYRINFKPHESFFASGNSIKNIFEQLHALGDIAMHAHYDSIPPCDKLDPSVCHIYWDMVLTTKVERDEIMDVFIFAENECDLSIKLIDEVDDDIDRGENDEHNYKKLGEILVDRGALSKDELEDTLAESSKIGDILVKKNLVEPKEVEAALVEQEQVRKVRKTRHKNVASATIRVQAQKLDSLVSLVGELVTAQARLASLAIDRNDAEVSAVSETVQSLVSGLRDETMSIRMVPIGTTFTTFKRLVRDLAGDLGKEINLNMIGGDTELDKTVIERLKDPLVHIVRNSVDHGIEKGEDRIAVGKDNVGNLTLKAEHTGAFVQITVEDDGAGLNLERIREKAIERNLISPDAHLTDKETCMLVFAPGFSTAESVTDISGRGVGMDVVKQNIEALRGSISIDSEFGKGTKITLRLPLTLAIIDGLMVQVAEEFYIIPLSMVEECMDLDMAEVERIKGRNILNLRGKALPFVKLREQLDFTGSEPEIEQVVITHVNGMEVGFVVDHVIGSHQTVIKSLGPGLRQAKHISGATILGDGTVALILDVQKLVN